MQNKILMIAGEKSGDLYGGEIASNILKLKPDSYIFGTGGESMRKAGVKLIYNMQDLSYLGYSTILLNIFDIRRKFRRIQELFLEHKPKVVILIDCPFLNLRLAEFIKKMQPDTKIVYYIPPAVWMRKKYRIRTLKAFVDEIIVIFFLEVDFYRKKGMRVHFFGHPMYNKFVNFKADKAAFRQKFGIDDNKKLIKVGLGSRNEYLKYMATIMLETIDILQAKSKQCVFLITFADSFKQQSVDIWKPQFTKRGCIILNNSMEAMAHSDMAICNVGTFQLEAVLMGLPNVCYFKGPLINTLISSPFYTGNTIALGNVLLGKKVFPEFVMPWLGSKHIAAKVMEILTNDNYYNFLKQKTTELKKLMATDNDHFQETAEFITSLG